MGRIKQFCVCALLTALLVLLFGCAPAAEVVLQPPSSTVIEEVSSQSEASSIATDTRSVQEIVAGLTLEQKAAQMVQGAVYRITANEMKKYSYGSVLSETYSMDLTQQGWKRTVLGLQNASMNSESKIPFVYGTDAVHGNIKCRGAVVFPHNIGIGAANDTRLTYEMGYAVAQEMKLSGMLWNFGPCVAVATEPRWGRTYESYSSDPRLVASLGVAFSKGQLDGGVMPCAKHYLADGNVKYGTGEGNYLIDRGDAVLTEEQVDELLAVYKDLIDAGVKTVMVSHSSLNGVKLHAHKELITDVLKGEMGFDGFVVSDWESIHNIPGDSLKDQVITAINAGIDMLMEPDRYRDCYKYIIEAVGEGSISQQRVDDAVTRIISVKKQMGLFDDPMQTELTADVDTVGSEQYRDIARKLVEKSLVLLKNDGNVLPLKQGSKVLVIGPAADDTGAQCGGWTISWQGALDSGDSRHVEQATTILEGLKAIAPEYNLTILTDESQASQADVVILCVGEIPYAEWEGDTEDMSITGKLALKGNKEAIDLAKKLDKPTVALIVAGRQVIIDDYLADWDAAVMCYLPGSEADGVANVLTGKVPFTGKLPMPWYKSTADIGTDRVQFEVGYGLTY